MASLFGNVSAEGGFDQSEVDFVTQLISSGQVTIEQAANQFGLPASVVADVYAANAPKFAAPAPIAPVISGRTAAAQLDAIPTEIVVTGSGGTNGVTFDLPFNGPTFLPDVGSLRGNVFDEDLEYQDAKELYQDIQEGLFSGATDSAGTVLKAIVDNIITSQNQAGTSAGNFPTTEATIEALNNANDPTAGLINLTVGSNQMLDETSQAAAQAAAVQAAAEEALSNVSAEGGFSEAEANEVYDLIRNGTVTPAEVSSVFNVPEGIINAALETIDAERAAAASTDPLGDSTSSLEPDGDLMGTDTSIFDSTASAASTAGSGATVVNTDAEHPWLYEGNGVLRNVFTGEVETNESGTENLVVGETYSSGTPTEATTRSNDTTDSGNINITLTPSVGGGTTSTVTNTTTTGSADTAVVDGGGGLDTGVSTIGAKGDKGDKGDQGLQGVIGAKGDKGDQGLQGVIGATGAKGDKGGQGLQGIQGVIGATGAQGEAGRDGRDGRDGLTGLLTLNNIATPIADEIFTSEFKIDYLKPEFIGLLDLTRGRTV